MQKFVFLEKKQMQSIKNDLTTCCFFVSDVFVLVLLRMKNKIIIKMLKMKTLSNLLSQMDSFDAPRCTEPLLLSVSVPEGEKLVSLNRQVKPALNH